VGSYQEFVDNYMLKKRPVVIKGGVAQWPAVGKWDVGYLKEKVGHITLDLPFHHRGDKQWSIGDFLSSLDGPHKANDNTRRYLTNANIAKYFPQLKSDVEPYCNYGLPDWSSSPYLPKDIGFHNYLVELLLGGESSGFPLHYDRGNMHAYLCQIAGRKKAVLLPPSEAKYVYPIQGNINVSSINDIWNPDYEKYPLLKQAKSFHVTLEPGDILYIPERWWHSTYNIDVSIGVTFNSVNSSNWWVFSRSICFKNRATIKAKIKGLILFPYLLLFGSIKTIQESLFGVRAFQPDIKKTWRVSEPE